MSNDEAEEKEDEEEEREFGSIDEMIDNCWGDGSVDAENNKETPE